eukprot:tig00000157_g9655.t1
MDALLPPEAAREATAPLVFLYRLRPGAAPGSFGLRCAAAAGLPRELVDRAGEVVGRIASGLPIRPLPSSAERRRGGEGGGHGQGTPGPGPASGPLGAGTELRRLRGAARALAGADLEAADPRALLAEVEGRLQGRAPAPAEA